MIFCLFLVFLNYCAEFLPSSEAEQKTCDDYCFREYGVKGVLTPMITNQRARTLAKEGPFKCNCPTGG